MRAIILAAGLGRRLGELTRHKTKAMIEVAGRTLIERALDALVAAGIRNVVIVVGHGGTALRDALSDRESYLEIEYVENPVYHETNNIYSLWLARDTLAQDDTFILESDIVFEPELIQDARKDPSENLAVVAPLKPWMDGTLTLLDDHDNILSVVPRGAVDRPDTSRYFKTVNIYKFSRRFSQDLYLPFLEAYIRAFGRSRFYEQVLSVITATGRGELRAHRTVRAWHEIDDIEDLRTADTLFAAPARRLSSYSGRHGGFWRFPRLLDACYLVNPFFPPERLVEEIQVQFAALLGAYPSGMTVQCELASRLFPVRASQLLIGNGASELIRSLRRVLAGPWCVPVPTFEEYLAHGQSDVLLETEGEGFSFVSAHLEGRTGEAQVVVLANPNNPTGHLMPTDEVLGLIRETARLGLRLILDESFIDFSDIAEARSFLNAEALDRNPHVVVLRSLGKSYGIAGLRLGLLATGDSGLLASLRADLPIWNIGSLAEAFLQLAPRYVEAHVESCRRVAVERNRFAQALSRLPGLRVLPSQANFLLCELQGGAEPIVSGLMEKFSILVKNCTGKAGLKSDRYMRIAVRTEPENQRIVAALGTLLST